MRQITLFIGFLFIYLTSFAQVISKIESAIYYKELKSIKELNLIQPLIKPSITKALFYKFYFEKLLVERYKRNLSLSKYSDQVLETLITSSFSTSDDDIINSDKKDRIKLVKEIDRLFSTKKIEFDNEGSTESKLYGALATNYWSPYLTYYNPEILLDNYILTSLNTGGTGAGTLHSLFKAEKNSIQKIDINNLLAKVSKRAEECLGKDCYDGFRLNGLALKKIENKYEISVPYYLSDDPECCPSATIKFITVDFYEYENDSIKYEIHREASAEKKKIKIEFTKCNNKL